MSTPDETPPEDVRPSEGLEGLYPFLYAGRAGLDTALEEAMRSTVQKAAEIVRLRRQMAEESAAELAACAEEMADRFAAGGRLFSFGNGGSSTDAQEVATVFLDPPRGRALPALSLTTDVAVVTALSNDVGFEVVFARQLAALGRSGDIAVGLSTSGGSANVIRAFEEAARRGMLTVGLAGGGGGRLAELGLLDHLFIVPSSSVHRIQEAQTTLYHVLWELTRHALEARVPAGGGQPPGAPEGPGPDPAAPRARDPGRGPRS
ncbi:D-sedoheptulose 7-phosphate isomerase [Streptosporangium becharense]|uniref:D-sedoheptulose 7-phosphate isomerase n=1 Tax=Streptosporangium becharense TaxID=1816182 RepID=A0A7W9IJN2_9ACTN|nr:SIS domain-containing protein [Streptosporangium becharense]MBB2910938.1 D-sedoheptulose 7-phosphate isomerase [Streptosporangium becharense]MBB5822003.1 D-sedoheptulose 7-phosphate isomerase [Streptosporangium becharense]